MRKYMPALHENHSILTSIRQKLLQSYGRVEGFEYNNLPLVLLDRKLLLCQQVMQILDIFHPGLTRSRALLLYEMHVPLVLVARERSRTNVIAVKEYNHIINEAIRMLETCTSILQWEDVNSLEAAVNRGAVAAINKLHLEMMNNNI